MLCIMIVCFVCLEQCRGDLALNESGMTTGYSTVDPTKTCNVTIGSFISFSPYGDPGTGWKSSNKADSTTGSFAMSLTCDIAVELTLLAEVSSEPSYDYGRIRVDGHIIFFKSGSHSSIVSISLSIGVTHLSFSYSKDFSISRGSDEARFHNFVLEGMQATPMLTEPEEPSMPSYCGLPGSNETYPLNDWGDLGSSNYTSAIYYYNDTGIVSPYYVYKDDEGTPYVAVASITDDVTSRMLTAGDTSWVDQWGAGADPVGSTWNMTRGSMRSPAYRSLHADSGAMLILQGHSTYCGHDFFEAASHAMVVENGTVASNMYNAVSQGLYDFDNTLNRTAGTCQYVKAGLMLKGMPSTALANYRYGSRASCDDEEPVLCIAPVNGNSKALSFVSALGCSISGNEVQTYGFIGHQGVGGADTISNFPEPNMDAMHVRGG